MDRAGNAQSSEYCASVDCADFRGVAAGWTGLDTPLLPEVVPDIDANPVIYYTGNSVMLCTVSSTSCPSVRPSVALCPSVSLVSYDDTRWNSSKIISPKISLTSRTHGAWLWLYRGSHGPAANRTAGDSCDASTLTRRRAAGTSTVHVRLSQRTLARREH